MLAKHPALDTGPVRTKEEQPDPDALRSNNRWRQPEFGFNNALDTCLFLSVSLNPLVVPSPDRIAQYSKHHSDEKSEERKTHLRQRETVIVLEDKGEGAEEKVEDS